MTDIVQRLRLVDPNQVLLMEPPYDTRYLHAGLLCHEAANEIERLRAEQLPTPPEECQTEAEKKAFAFGYWSGVAAMKEGKP